MKNMKKILAVLLAAIMICLTFVGCSGNNEKSDLAKIQAAGKIVVGITDYAPMDYKDENGNWTGFDAEFAQAFAKELGVEVEFIEIDWDNKFLELETGAIDCIWNGMTITDEVLLNTSCSDPYAKNEQVVVMAADKAADYATVDSLKGLTFAVEAGSAAEGAAEDAEYKFTAVTAQTDTLLEVKAGSTDAAIIDSTMAKSMTGEGTAYADLAVAVSLTKEEYGVGFRKDSDLTAKLNAFIAQCEADGTLQALSDKYEVALAD